MTFASEWQITTKDEPAWLVGAVTPGEAANANAGLTGALGRLLAIAENYPQLRSNQNFIRLQDNWLGLKIELL